MIGTAARGGAHTFLRHCLPTLLLLLLPLLVFLSTDLSASNRRTETPSSLPTSRLFRFLRASLPPPPRNSPNPDPKRHLHQNPPPRHIRPPPTRGADTSLPPSPSFPPFALVPQQRIQPPCPPLTPPPPPATPPPPLPLMQPTEEEGDRPSHTASEKELLSAFQWYRSGHTGRDLRGAFERQRLQNAVPRHSDGQWLRPRRMPVTESLNPPASDAGGLHRATYHQAGLIPSFNRRRKLAVAGHGSVSNRRSRSNAMLSPRASPVATALTLHAYDHCPFCTRTRLVLGSLGVPYTLKFYGYGQGADPDLCEGHGYNKGGGPVVLTGKKSLPVIEGEGVPDSVMAESGAICSFASSFVGINDAPVKFIATSSGRKDIADWVERMKPIRQPLERPRLIRQPIPDFADERDIEYSKWTHTKSGFDYSKALQDTKEHLEALRPMLSELELMLKGETEDGTPCLNPWGFSMDDIIVLPILRNLSCVKDIQWSPRIRSYLELSCARAGVPLFRQHAC